MKPKKSKKENYYTLMMVPHDHRKVYSFKLSGWMMGVASIVLLLLVGFSSFVLTRHANYELTKRANIRLTEKNAFFIQELARTHDAFNRVTKIEDELRAMLKMKSKNNVIKYTGEGGPSPADQTLMANLSNHSTLTTKEFAKSLSFLKSDAKARMDSYRELKKYIATQRSLMAARPTEWPVRGWITSRFGPRQSPFFNVISNHEGIDIANEEGSSIKAPADGIITFCGWQGSYGKLVVIDHGYGFSTRYGHLSRLLVNVGQRVRRGQVIAFMGNTGRSTASHLHYEIRVNGVPVDPFKYLKK